MRILFIITCQTKPSPKFYITEKAVEGLIMECLLVYIIMLFLPCLSTELVNLALNRPTRISKAYVPWGYSHFGVDGHLGTHFFQDFCAYATDPDPDLPSLPYIWWTVDLGDQYVVSHVIIYLRRDTDSPMTNIYLELSAGSPLTCGDDAAISCAIVNWDLLWTAEKPFENITCAPGAAGRYLTVRRHQANLDSIALCEVQVYGTLASASSAADKARNCSGTTKMTKKVDFGLSGDDVSQGESTTRVDCSIECMRKGACAAYSFNPGLNQCQYAVGEFIKLAIVASPVWETYTFC